MPKKTLSVADLIDSHLQPRPRRPRPGKATLGAISKPHVGTEPPPPPPPSDPVAATLAQRGQVHGDYSENARITQELKDVIRESQGYHYLAPDQKQTLEVICDKMSRILSGNPNFDDHWHDIQGYAKLSESRAKRRVERLGTPIPSTISPE